jgi:RNA polymerase sigma-54 factor
VNLGLDISLRLQQKMSFNMIQSLKLLQVNTLQLEQMLQTELEQNPLLEVEEETAADAEIDAEERAGEADGAGEEGDGGEDKAEDYLEELTGSGEDDGGIDWEEYLEDGFDPGGSYREETDPNEERYEPTAVYEETLEERLIEQLSGKKISKRAKRLVQFLIGCLDDDGYLRIDTEEIAARIDAAQCEVVDALEILHRLDPPGVGARDLRECMMMQLRAKDMEESLAMAIVSKHWELLEKKKIPEIAKLQGVEARQVQEAIAVIAGLDPKPGHCYGADTSAAIVPDLIVRKVEGRFIVTLNDGTIPSLYINKRYAAMIRRGSKAKKDVKEYVREKFNSATWFIKAIEQRRVTMLRVMNAIVERQKIFFENGPPNLIPLKQQEVADDIGMHISTVSRVVNNKYVQTSHGIFELRYFFTESVGAQRGAKRPGHTHIAAAEVAGAGDTADGGVDVTAERIRSKIRQLIDGEDTASPLSDQKIADILEKEGLSAARRTVAKYREQMRIPTTRMRQTYG